MAAQEFKQSARFPYHRDRHERLIAKRSQGWPGRSTTAAVERVLQQVQVNSALDQRAKNVFARQVPFVPRASEDYASRGVPLS